MSRIGISITKSVAFRSSTQEFTNVYYYKNDGALPDQTQAEALIDQITAIEKTHHATIVTFLRGRCWSAGGTQAENNMIAQKNLTGTGARTEAAGLDRERAFLFRLRAGSDSRGQPVYLRKWYHSCAPFDASISLSTSVQNNTGGFTTAERATLASGMTGIKNLTGSNGPWTICAKSGREATAGAEWTAHQFLEHHQLGDMWRAQ